MNRLFHIVPLTAAVIFVGTTGSQLSDAAAAAGSEEQVEGRARVTDMLGSPNWGENITGPLCGVFAACTALDMNLRRANWCDSLIERLVDTDGLLVISKQCLLEEHADLSRLGTEIVDTIGISVVVARVTVRRSGPPPLAAGHFVNGLCNSLPSTPDLRASISTRKRSFE